MTRERQDSKWWVVAALVAGVAAVSAVYVLSSDGDPEPRVWTDPPRVGGRSPGSSDEGPPTSDPLGEPGVDPRRDGVPGPPRVVVRERRTHDDAGVRIVHNDSPTARSRPRDLPARSGLIVRDPNDPDAPPRLLDEPVRTGETTPAMLLQRARALQALMEQQTTRLNEQRAEALAAGETERVERIDFHLRRLENSRPTVARRIAELEEQAAAAGGG